jgi:hypothetical protein
MGCCNSKRSAAARPGFPRAAIIRPSPPSGANPGAVAMTLLYKGPDHLALRGPVSGTVYRPMRKGQRIDIDQRDVAAFVRAALFDILRPDNV